MTSIIPTPAEARLVAAAATGDVCDFAIGHPSELNPALEHEWRDDCAVRADVIRALCLNQRTDWPVHTKGVQIRGARIVGVLDFEAASLPSPLSILRCRVDSPIQFRGAKTRTLNLSGTQIAGMQGDRIQIDGALILRDAFVATGEVSFAGARITGGIELTGGTICNISGTALRCDLIEVGGDVMLDEGFRAEGEVRFLSARIAGGLYCTKATLRSQTGDALICDGASVASYVYLSEGFVAEGEVSLSGVHFGRDLCCSGGSFLHPQKDALSCYCARIEGSVYLDEGFQSDGAVALALMEIKGNVFCDGGTFRNQGGVALNARRLRVHGLLDLHSLKEQPRGEVDFRFARIGTLQDDNSSWPPKSKLRLTGFVYETFAGEVDTRAKWRREWLERQYEERIGTSFRPQPYEQLARVLRNMGYERDAREIAIAKQEMLRKSGSLGLSGTFWNWLLSATIAHGYKPWRAVLWALPVIGIGWLLFGYANMHDAMVPLSETPRTFHPLAYSLDVFLPIIDMHQEDSWLPRNGGPEGWWLWIYLWAHIGFGWLLTSLFVAGLSGIIKKE